MGSARDILLFISIQPCVAIRVFRFKCAIYLMSCICASRSQKCSNNTFYAFRLTYLEILNQYDDDDGVLDIGQTAQIHFHATCSIMSGTCRYVYGMVYMLIPPRDSGLLTVIAPHEMTI